MSSDEDGDYEAKLQERLRLISYVLEQAPAELERLHKRSVEHPDPAERQQALIERLSILRGYDEMTRLVFSRQKSFLPTPANRPRTIRVTRHTKSASEWPKRRNG